MSVAAVAGSVAAALGSAADALAAAGVESPRLDAELLLERATGSDRARLAAAPEAGVTAPAAREFGAMVRRRLRREPLAYILGTKGFRRIELGVDRRVLIPRPETELLVELALDLDPATVLDVGTGSGAIALALADELRATAITATDTSLDALAVAQANRERLGLGDRVQLAYGSVEPGRVDLLVANLPYVSDGEWQGLAPGDPRVRASRGAGQRPDRARVDRVAARRGRRRARAAAGDRARGRVRPGADRGRARAPRRVRADRDSPRPRRDRPGCSRMGVSDAFDACVLGGGVALFPADGLYGLACDPTRAEAIERIHGLKGRDDGKPAAVMYFSPLAMREVLSALGPRTRDALGAMLPGPVTLVVANPQRRYPLACREDPERLGLRLIGGTLAGAAAAAFQTSANRSGEPAPARLGDVDAAIRAGVDLEIDGGELTGMPSTVVDITGIEGGGEPVILREGALSSQEALRRLDPARGC